jgi:tripartite-type tricarboxylate transporter receptor subunit TctC
MEPYAGVARKNETIVGEPLTGQALADYVKKLNASYEQLIKEAGLYKSERK